MALAQPDNKMEEVMKMLYAKVINGLPKCESAQELGDYYICYGEGDLELRINRLIRWQNAKAATAGFLANIGGLITLPVTLPAEIVSSLYVEIRMIAAIAHMCGMDVQSDEVRTLVFMALVGMTLADAVAAAGAQAAGAITTRLIINALSKQTIGKINKAVGQRLLTRFGTTGIIQLGKIVPVIAGVVGGALNAWYMNFAGNAAKGMFMQRL